VTTHFSSFTFETIHILNMEPGVYTLLCAEGIAQHVEKVLCVGHFGFFEKPPDLIMGEWTRVCGCVGVWVCILGRVVQGLMIPF
jgi:hypothetical protein